MSTYTFEVHRMINVLKTDKYYKVTAKSRAEAEEYIKKYVASTGKYAQPDDTTYEPLPDGDCTYEVYWFSKKVTEEEEVK